MAHNLAVHKNQTMMAYAGTTPWHGLGTKLDGVVTAEQMMAAAQLDRTVVKAPLSMSKAGLDDKSVETQFYATRYADNDVALGVVTSSYTVLQNREAFSFFDDVAKGGEVKYETAGALGNGELIWALAKLPGVIRVGKDDVTDKYLLFTNSHDGSASVRAYFTPVRVVCQNTLTLSQQSAIGAISVRHTKNARQNLTTAMHLMQAAQAQSERLQQLFNEFAEFKVSTQFVDKYIRTVIVPPESDSSRSQSNYDGKLEGVRRAVDAENSATPTTAGTLWALYNGVTRWVDHGQYTNGREVTQERRMENVLWGQGRQIKGRALDTAESMLQATHN